LQARLSAESPVQLVTLTTDPGFDTPAVLAKYGERFEARSNRWTFLTGAKAQIGRLVIDSLKLTAIEKKTEERADDADLFDAHKKIARWTWRPGCTSPSLVW
jgi:cytochrome oxidase Cu insertion factor (SCO1/SenC/PrrC family)